MALPARSALPIGVATISSPWAAKLLFHLSCHLGLDVHDAHVQAAAPTASLRRSDADVLWEQHLITRVLNLDEVVGAGASFL